MEYQIGTLSEHLLSELGTSGEIVYERFLENVPYDRKYALKVIKDLSDKGIIRKYVYKSREDRIKTIRLRFPKGHMALKEISEELLLHFEFLEGGTDTAYRGNSSYRQRKLFQAILLSALDEDGYFTIDFLSARYEMAFGSGWRKEDKKDLTGSSIFDEKCSPKGIREILRSVDSPAPYFFTGKAILKEIHQEAAEYADERIGRGSAKRKPAASSRAIGVIVKDDRYALCYYYDGLSCIWSRKVEIATSMYLKNYQQSFQISVSPVTECFIYTDTVDNIVELLRDKKNKRLIDPLSVFDKVYALPIRENHGDLARTILEPGVFSRMRGKLLGESYDPGENKRLGFINGRPVYCILDSELGYIKELSEKIEEDALVIAHEWQEKIIEEFFPPSCGMMALSEEDFKSWIPEEGGEGA